MVLEHLVFFPPFLSSQHVTAFSSLVLGISLSYVISSIDRDKEELEPPFDAWDLSPLARISKRGCLVRLAFSHDDEAIDSIEKTCFPVGLLSEESEKGQEVQSFLTLVAVMHQRIVGYITLSAQHECDSVCVESLAILPDYRPRVTSTFLQTVRDLLLQNRVGKVSALCREKTVYRLLKKHGQRLGFTIFKEEKQEEALQGEFFYHLRLLVQSI